MRILITLLIETIKKYIINIVYKLIKYIKNTKKSYF